MKKIVSAGALLFVLSWLTPALHAQSTVQPGTLVHLTLINGLTTSVAHDRDHSPPSWSSQFSSATSCSFRPEPKFTAR
jgi:hypothetical protein